MSANHLVNALNALADPKLAAYQQQFYKTGPGEYADGDVFIGIRVPPLRKLAKQYQDLELLEVKKLLTSPVHETRLTAMFILVLQYQTANKGLQKRIYGLCVDNLDHINHWDIIDTTVPHTLGAYIYDHNSKPLFQWVKSPNLWHRRIAMLAPFYHIRQQQFTLAIEIAERLVADEHDLIHKAVGWMLREIAKRDMAPTVAFLDKHYQTMPRTMLRYAIERFPTALNRHYMGLTN